MLPFSKSTLTPNQCYATESKFFLSATTENSVAWGRGERHQQNQLTQHFLSERGSIGWYVCIRRFGGECQKKEVLNMSPSSTGPGIHVYGGALTDQTQTCPPHTTMHAQKESVSDDQQRVPPHGQHDVSVEILALRSRSHLMRTAGRARAHP